MARMLLEMQHITKTFGSVKALGDVNLQVQEGEIHALVGENDLIANGLEALNNLFARYEETRRLRANLRCGHFFQIK